MTNVAVVGSGMWGRNLVRNFAALGALRTICDADPARLEGFRAQFPHARLTTSLGDVLKDDETEGVVIATPAASHYSVAREALLAGKDVFVEKPLALKSAEGAELIEIADRQRRVLMVGHLLRYHPAILKLKALIDDGQLGKLHYIYSNRLNLGRFRTEENILWSFAPHDISAIVYLLGEMPTSVSARGGSFVTDGIPDVTVTTLDFRSGVKGHIFVSWLHPYKEQKLVVVGDRRMAVFDDVEPERKLVLIGHHVEWVGRLPVPRREEAEVVPFSGDEPLRLECQHFLDCVAARRAPDTDGREGLRILEILEASQRSLDGQGPVVEVEVAAPAPARYFTHATAVVDEPAEIGEGTRIWHFSHVMKDSRIGRGCSIGQNAFVASGVVVGDNVKLQNNVSLYAGVVLEDDVFCGPSMVFTNVINPRSHIERKSEYRQTLVRKGATLGANCTVICGHTIGRYAFVAAGAVVTSNVPDYALVAGVPGRVIGWMCACGTRLAFTRDGDQGVERGHCPSCGADYVKKDETTVEPMREEAVIR
jgi:UDP-2-acetamido-3-amino-2,3-dideoxy-glucuronate N-acetyltransferase